MVIVFNAFSYNVSNNNTLICLPNIGILFGKNNPSKTPSTIKIGLNQSIKFSKKIISSFDESGFLYLTLVFKSQLLAIK